MSATPPLASAHITPATRQRLQQLFDRARQSFDKGGFEYAHDLFAQCAAEDSGNLLYLQHFRANLAKFRPVTKKSSFANLTTRSGRAGVEKLAEKTKWNEAFAAGFAALKKDPSDTGVLAELATACGKRLQTECQLFYLRWALDIEPKSMELNRQTALALEAIGEFEQAIACWQRVLQQKPADEEAQKAVRRLSVEHTIHQAGYNQELLKGAADVGNVPGNRVSDYAKKSDHFAPIVTATEQELLDLISAQPADHLHYSDLARLYQQQGKLADAERLLTKALTITGGGDLSLRERLEDVYLLRTKQQVEVARKRAASAPSAATKELAEQMIAQAHQAELEVYAARSEREPSDLKLRYELGLRLKRVGKHREAIPHFQQARGDVKRRAESELNLGECFQHIEQFKLAMASYEAAVTVATVAELEVRKLALYRSGVLAMGLKDLDKAEARLTELAGLDFAYRDVGARLDKIAKLRHK